jgi:hypothetical protein
MTNDLGQFLLVISCLFGGIATLLVVLAAVDPQTDRAALAPPRPPQPVRGRDEGS